MSERQRARRAATVLPVLITLLVGAAVGGLVIILIIWAASDPELIGVTLSPEVTIGFLAMALKMMAPIKAPKMT